MLRTPALAVKMLSPVFGAQKPEKTVPPLSPLIVNHHKSPASDTFVEQVNQGLLLLPKAIGERLYNLGGRVQCGSFLTKMFSDLWGRPRGYDEGQTWQNATAFAKGFDIAMAEFMWYKPSDKPSKFTPGESYSLQRLVRVTPPQHKNGQDLCRNTMPHKVVLHEMGHVFDRMADYGVDKTRLLSKTGAFIRCYHEDLDQLSPEEQKVWYYQLQPDGNGNPSLSGTSEAFAESFAALYGGGCTQPKPFYQAFKNTVEFVGLSVLDFLEKQRKVS